MAWIGPVGKQGGVATIGLSTLEELLKSGINVDLYSNDSTDAAKEIDEAGAKLRIFDGESSWRWNRWYSSSRMTAFVTGTLAKVRAQNRLYRTLLGQHEKEPYDVVFQFSQSELLGLRRHLSSLPPVIVHPCVHAAGEYRWHRAEAEFAKESEGAVKHYLARAILAYRAYKQRQDLRHVACVVGLSNRFNYWLQADYGISPERQAVLYHAIKSPGYGAAISQGKRRILYISRLSVRKGFDRIIKLSHRLDDLADEIEIQVIGDATLWSDYTGHIPKLNARVAKHHGHLGHDEISRRLAGAEMLILPSLYEPGGIVVGEALAAGVPVVVSDEVGSAEAVQGLCCRRFPAGNDSEFEDRVRSLLADMVVREQEIRTEARAEYERLFEPARVGARFVNILESVARKGRTPGSVLRPIHTKG